MHSLTLALDDLEYRALGILEHHHASVNGTSAFSAAIKAKSQAIKTNTRIPLCEKMGLSGLNTEAVINATEHDPLVSKSYTRAGAMGSNSFPARLVVNE